MKKTFFIAAVAAISSLVSCEEQNADSGIKMQTDSDDKVRLCVNVVQPDTKSSASLPGSAIGKLEVMVFDEDGTLEDYQSKSGSSLGELSCTKGTKTVVAVVNSKTSLSSIANFDDLKKIKSDLADNEASYCVMEGMQQIDVTDSQTLNLTVSRKVAKVQVENITLNFALDHQKTSTVKAEALYLINVPGDMAFFSDAAPSKWYNKLAAETKSLPIIYDNLSQKELKEGSPITSVYSYYTYPNPYTTDTSDPVWSERPTRLVLELSINSKIYYYPVTLPKFESNHLYRISLTVTRPGSSSPDIPVDKYVVAPKIQVEPWNEGEPINQVI